MKKGKLRGFLDMFMCMCVMPLLPPATQSYAHCFIFFFFPSYWPR